MILPQCDGPFLVQSVSGHTAQLVDPTSGEPAGPAVSLARLIRFHFPAGWAGPDAREVESRDATFDALRVGSFIVVAPNSRKYYRAHVARVERIFREQRQAEVQLFWVAPGHRTGPWTARRWSAWTGADGVPVREVVGQGEILEVVALQEMALTSDSLERLDLRGLPMGQPRRDAAMRRD